MRILESAIRGVRAMTDDFQERKNLLTNKVQVCIDGWEQRKDHNWYGSWGVLILGGITFAIVVVHIVMSFPGLGPSFIPRVLFGVALGVLVLVLLVEAKLRTHTRLWYYRQASDAGTYFQQVVDEANNGGDLSDLEQRLRDLDYEVKTELPRGRSFQQSAERIWRLVELPLPSQTP
jgi:hypothetical protein